jgi:fumarate hydratase subunit alpha
MDRNKIIDKVAQCLVEASTKFRDDQLEKYQEAIAKESNSEAKWVMEKILEDARVAEEKKFPLCDDTGIPHVFIEFGDNVSINIDVEKAVKEGVRVGLEKLPGRPMAVKGNDIERIEQSAGLYDESGALLPAPIIFKSFPGKGLKVTILMLGGGPEIRSKTFRVFHKHDSKNFIIQVAQWAKEVSGQLGCTPCVPAIGIGRTHYEASVLMLEAMKDGDLRKQNDYEKLVMKIVNESNVGPLGLGGKFTALGSFIKVGQQRASGVRIACMRPGCCFDPRRATILID